MYRWELASAADERLGNWRALQEVAGLVTPFTERVRKDAEKAVADAHRAALQSARDEYEEQLKAACQASETNVAERIKSQLLVLTGYKNH